MCSSFDGPFQNLEEDELVACRDEGLRRLSLAEAVHDLAGLPKAGCEAGEITVAGYQAETVDIARVQEIHRINDERRVRRILSLRVGELLDGLDGMAVKMGLPPNQVLRGPVTERPLDCGGPKLGDFFKQFLRHRCGGVVRIDENCQSGGICARQIASRLDGEGAPILGGNSTNGKQIGFVLAARYASAPRRGDNKFVV